VSDARAVLILSTKSAGSSALQRALVSFSPARHVEWTRHYEDETLFWVKAASVLGRPQVNVSDSEVPIPRAKARRDLVKLLELNARFAPPDDDDALVFEGWRSLCLAHAPVFVEKSPHHLHQWSALELIAEAITRNEDIPHLLVGLVRHPMDTLYSMWRRWRGIPERVQYEWMTAMMNLLRLENIVGERMVRLRYEDIVADPAALRPVFDFIGTGPPDDIGLHGRSLAKWKDDPAFGFRLAPDVRAFAEGLGYDPESMENRGSALWPARRALTAAGHKSLRPARRAARALRRAMRRFG
jgi:hypothetical protein